MNIVNTSFIKKGDIIQFGHFPQSQSEETEFHAVGNNIYLDNKENKVYKQFCENFSSKEDKYFNLEPILWEVVEVNQNYYRLLSLKMLIYSRLGDDDHNNCTYSNSDLRKYLNRDFYNLAFSSEEQRMILMLVNGAKYGEIAEQVHLSEDSVKYHIKKIYKNLGIHRKDELISLLNVYGITL